MPVVPGELGSRFSPFLQTIRYKIPADAQYGGKARYWPPLSALFLESPCPNMKSFGNDKVERGKKSGLLEQRFPIE
jgi:hypothetical protein